MLTSRFFVDPGGSLWVELSSSPGSACMCLVVQTQDPATKLSTEDALMCLHAEGTFEVKNAPLPADDATSATPIGRFALDKQFHGDLEGVSRGEMLGAGNPATGTAGYVAVEYITGALNGLSGSFALQHFGTMQDNKFELTVRVVPGSGTGELIGISGAMTIAPINGKHSWKFEYTLPPRK